MHFATMAKLLCIIYFAPKGDYARNEKNEEPFSHQVPASMTFFFFFCFALFLLARSLACLVY
jgi:hypothetical protein